MKVKVKIKLSEGAVMPKKAHIGDSGLDLTATSKKLCPEGFIEYGTGIHIQLPKNHVGLIFPRSSISKINMSLTNSVGVIDENYTGEVRFRFKPSGAGKGMYNIGDRVGQLIVMPYPEVELEEVEELSETARGDGGFGSSDLDLERTHINEAGLVEKFTLAEELNK